MNVAGEAEIDFPDVTADRFNQPSRLRRILLAWHDGLAVIGRRCECCPGSRNMHVDLDDPSIPASRQNETRLPRL